MSAAVPSRFTRAVVMIVGALVAMAALSVALGSATASAAGAQLRKGSGYSVAHGDFVGFYTASTGAKVYCLSPRKALPASITLATVSRYPGVSQAASRQLAYALSRWGNAATAQAAAAESQVVNSIVGNHADVARRAAQLPKSVAKEVSDHLALTRRLYGPYVTTVRTPKAVLPGQSSTGTVVITSASGHRLTGTTVLLSSSKNGSVPNRIKTDSKGFGRFTYRATDVGEVHITATAVDLPPTVLHVNHPASTEQHMVTWSPVVASRGAASFQKAPSGFSNQYACTTTCDGKPTTRLRACTPASGRASRIGYHYGSKTAYVVFPASTTRMCKNLNVVTRDGNHVSAGWQYKTKHGWSKVVKAAGSFVVDCPPAPPVAVTMTYDCTTAAVTIGLAKLGAKGTWSPLVNSTKHRMVLVIGGAAQQRIYAGHGETAVFTASAPCGSPKTYTMQAGVQRASGQYNYGPVGSVTTP
jgi:hypothetical protein